MELIDKKTVATTGYTFLEKVVDESEWVFMEHNIQAQKLSMQKGSRTFLVRSYNVCSASAPLARLPFESLGNSMAFVILF